MKGFAKFLLIALLVIPSHLLSAQEAELDEQLNFLRPLMNQRWVGGYVGIDSPDIEIVLNFKPILNGKAISYIRNVIDLDCSALTQFYWNPSRSTVCFISLNTRGIVDEGVVEITENRIEMSGKSHRESNTVEFRTILEVEENGMLRDTFLRKEDGEWVQGHVQEFVASE